MKYTQEQLDGMSDELLSLKLAEALGYIVVYWDVNLSDYLMVRKESHLKPFYFNIKNWNDIMPLAAEYEIDSVRLPASKKWVSEYSLDKDVKFIHESRQRAIACSLTLVLQEQQQ